MKKIALFIVMVLIGISLPAQHRWSISSESETTIVGDKISRVQTTSDSSIIVKTNRKIRYNYGLFIDFHWGWNNWGTNPFNGLMGISTPPGYELRTTFSSYQLSTNYSVVKTDHFDLSLGLGYESDVYKFSNPYVEYDDKSFHVSGIYAVDGYYSTRFVTRYVQLPIGFGWRLRPHDESLNLRLCLIPALGYCSDYTGLKHELHTDGRNPQDQTNLRDFVNPYKLDVRFEVKYGPVGFFLQVSTMPLFAGTQKIYPIKIGFML